MNELSSLKAAWYLDKIAALREGKDIVPAHVQLILSDLCNQDCLPAGTMIECPHGLVPIENLSVGDMVVGPDGRAVPVGAVGNRMADEVFEIRIGERVIQATGEHPFLTVAGWIEAKHLKPGWRAAVRVRVRAESEMERPLETMGTLRVRPSQDAINRLFRVESLDASEGERRDSSAVSVWVRPAGEAAFAWSGALLGELPKAPPDARQDRDTFPGASYARIRADAAEQSDVRPEDSSACAARAQTRTIADEGGTAVLALDEATRIADKFSRDWQALDQSEEPGFPRIWPKESNRDFNYWDLQRWFGRSADGGNIRSGSRSALHGERLGVPRGLLQSRSSAQTAGQSTASDARLLLAGIELERGLELRPIDSIRRIPGRVRVYNFSCPPIEAYEANGVIVHNCHFCAYRMEGGFSTQNFADEQGNRNPNRRIETVKALEILDDCASAGVKAIEFTGGGEPTVHPDWQQIIGHAQALGMQTGLVTNGVRLKPDPVVVNLTWLRISLDAGRPHTYERIRRSKAWPQVMQTLKYAGWLTGPLVGVGFVITRENHTEIADACQLVKDYGIPYVRLSAMFSTNGAKYYEGLLGHIEQERAEAKAMETDTFKVIDFFGNRIEDLEQHSPDYSFCGEQQFVTYIGGDLRVYTCCTNAYTDKGRVGDLRNMRFAEWLATKRQFGFDARGCGTCQFNDKNKVIAFMLDKSPPHIGFV